MKRRSILPAFILSALPLFEVQAAKPKIQAELHIVPTYLQDNEDSLFILPEDITSFPARSSRNEIELELSWNELNAITTLRNEVVDGRSPDNSAVLNELYWDGVWHNHDLSVGKKIYSYGVGFAYRPLDVIQRENRRRLFIGTLEGVPAISWYHFRDNDAFTLIYANPGQRNHSIETKDDESLNLRYYRLHDNADLHAMIRLSERNRVEIGSGFSLIVNDQQEIHGSLLYQHRGEQFINTLTGTTQTLASNDPMQQVSIEHPVKALVGSSFTNVQGWSLLMEVWYDGEAYHAEQWQDLFKLTQAQRALQNVANIPTAAIISNINASTQSFARVNLLRWNALLRFSYDGERLDSNLEILNTPEDGGYVTTLNTVYEREKHRFHLSLRKFSGPADSAYQLLPVDWVILAAWEWVLI